MFLVRYDALLPLSARVSHFNLSPKQVASVPTDSRANRIAAPQGAKDVAYEADVYMGVSACVWFSVRICLRVCACERVRLCFTTDCKCTFTLPPPSLPLLKPSLHEDGGGGVGRKTYRCVMVTCLNST